MPRITVVTPCYNEEGNVRLLFERVKRVFEGLDGYEFDHIFADNLSTDGTLAVLEEMAAEDKRVKVIANMSNYGPTRSVFNALLAAQGDAVVLLAADLQDPPECITQFVAEWEKGYKVVFGVRAKRNENWFLELGRKVYYRLLGKLSDDTLIKDAGDFGLFDQSVVQVLRGVQDTNPYIRGLVASLRLPMAGVPYTMAERHSGSTSTTLFSLFSYALNGFINHTLVPLRLASFLGIVVSMVAFTIALVQLVLKLILWDSSVPGLPTLTIGMFFLGGVQLFILGYIGEYVGALHRQQKGLPLVIEKKRINF